MKFQKNKHWRKRFLKKYKVFLNGAGVDNREKRIKRLLRMVEYEKKQSRKDSITQVIQFLEKIRYIEGTKELQPFTVNPLILELKALRGDYD